MAIEALLGSYPRNRPPLSAAHEAVYAEQYKLNREGGSVADGAAQKLEQWMHHKVAACSGGPILELGAGTLNHLRFETNSEAYDIVEPFRELFDGKPELARVRNSYESVQDIPAANSYRRIISIAVLEHLTDLPRDVARSAQLLAPDGVFQAGIPSEGGFLWWLGWRGATGLAYYLRTGLDYGVVMRHEHVNRAREIEAVIRHLFADVSVRRYPTPFHQLSFYAYLEARRPRLDRAQQLLDAGL
jgi:SAM-dependent methyltransferase